MQFLCERLDFIHIYGLKKLMFLHKLTGINNNCLQMCLRVYRRCSEFINALSLILIYVIVVLSKVMFLVIFMQL